MGKGQGEHPPQKFVSDQCFCQLSIFIFIGAIMTLASISAGMDNGGSFPFPYFISGFILSPVLVVNLFSRWYIVRIVSKKGVTRKNIIDALNNSTFGKFIWPWSCRLGMLLCIPGTILTGIGGINCEVKKENETVVEVKNNCYYNIEGELGDLYKGLAIGLLVLHIASFVYLLFSNCPVHSVLEQIKEDPRGNNVAPARAPAAAATNSTQPIAATTITTGASGTSNRTGNEEDMQAKIRHLEARLAELEEREAQARQISVIPPPPSYSELMVSDEFKNSRANPV